MAPFYTGNKRCKILLHGSQSLGQQLNSSNNCIQISTTEYFKTDRSDTDSCTMQILWERDPNLNMSQWKHVLHNTLTECLSKWFRFYIAFLIHYL